MRETAGFETFDAFFQHWRLTGPMPLRTSRTGGARGYAELEVFSRRYAAFLGAHGVGKGDRVAWIGKNSDLYYGMLLSCGGSAWPWCPWVGGLRLRRWPISWRTPARS